MINDFYEYSQHFDAVKSLHNNDSIVISKPDKRSGVMVFKRNDYVKKWLIFETTLLNSKMVIPLNYNHFYLHY